MPANPNVFPCAASGARGGMTLKVYRHHRPLLVWAPVLVVGAMAVGLVGLSLGTIAGAVEPPPPPPFFVLFALFVTGNGWAVARTVYEIRLEDDRLELATPLGDRRVRVDDIESIRPAALSDGSVLVLRHRRGRATFAAHFTGMHELLSELKRRNPRIDLVGC